MSLPPAPSDPHRHVPDLPTLDTDRLDVLRELCIEAGPEVLREMFGSWEDDTVRHLDGIRQALAAADRQALKAAAHALKGSCANLGIVRLSELGRLLELEIELPAEAEVLLAEMQDEFDCARAQIAEASA